MSKLPLHETKEVRLPDLLDEFRTDRLVMGLPGTRHEGFHMSEYLKHPIFLPHARTIISEVNADLGMIVFRTSQNGGLK